MRSCWILIAGLIATSAPAQVLRAIDPTRTADANSKMVTTEDLSFATVPQPSHPTASVPLSGKRFPTKAFATQVVDFSTLDLATRPMTTISSQNFQPKRAAITDATVPAATVPPRRAPITDREIPALTPVGQDQLKNQLNKLP